ncbi:MAG: putative amidohydrolase YtcJ [Halioglobus sp.]|jgi:predicted amidohydrolase YtcJ
MKKIIFALFVVSFVNQSFASVLIYNVHGYTMDHGVRVSFSALEYDKGKVTHLYPTAQSAAASDAGQKIDGEGATLLPGLIDAHGHVSSLGRALSTVDLVGSESEAVAAARTAEFVKKFPEQKWILGRGWNQVLWASKEFPNRDALDAVAADRPVAFERIDGHALWVNSAVLSLAGIHTETLDPDGGQIIRDEKGAATGVLIDNAMDMVYRIMPPPSSAQLMGFELRAMENLASLGVTSVHDAGINATEVRALQALHKKQQMPVRVYAMLNVLDPENDEYLDRGPIPDPQGMLDIVSVKISADGALGSRGAALFEDYSDEAGNKGLLLLKDEQLSLHINRAMAAGYQVNTHAIGDLANAKVLDYYEQFIAKHDSRHLRHRIEHSQILRLQDIPRFESLGVVASIQPTHATSDKNMAGDRLGEHRLRGAYVWNSLQKAGAVLAGGSDFPVEPANPMFGLHAAVTRQDRDNQPLGGWMEDQKLSRDVSLSMFTEGAAFAAHQDAKLGRLLPGYYADFILLRDDYFTVPEQDIWKNQVIATYVAGRRVFPATQE